MTATVPTRVAATFDSYVARAAEAHREAVEALAQVASYQDLMDGEHSALAVRHARLAALHEDNRHELADLRGRVESVRVLLGELTDEYDDGRRRTAHEIAGMVAGELYGLNAENVVVTLIGERFAEHDVRTAIDSLINAGLELMMQPADATLLTAAEVDVLRRQLRGE